MGSHESRVGNAQAGLGTVHGEHPCCHFGKRYCIQNLSVKWISQLPGLQVVQCVFAAAPSCRARRLVAQGNIMNMRAFFILQAMPRR
jgi:hypothetical protein